MSVRKESVLILISTSRWAQSSWNTYCEEGCIQNSREGWHFKAEGYGMCELESKHKKTNQGSIVAQTLRPQVDEVAVPQHVARVLTFPDRVTPHNIQRLRQAILNGSPPCCDILKAI